jgi:hypothetical protein
VPQPNQLRRQYLVNARFQLRWASFIALTGAMTATLFATPLCSSIDEENRLIRDSLRADKLLYETSEDMTILLLNMPETRQDESENIGKRFDSAHKSFAQVKEMKDGMIAKNESQKTMIGLAVIVIAIALFGIGILVTHAVAGPMYVIKQHLESWGQGQTPSRRPLRKGDEFTDVYDTLHDVLEKKKGAGQAA